MSDYIAALRQGVASAEEAARNLAEIEAALAEVASEVWNFTDGDIEVVEVSKEGLMAVALEAMGLGVEHTVRTMKTLYFRSTKDNSQKFEVCKIFFGDRGYPCHIAFAGSSHACFDLASLKIALSKLLSDHGTGNIIFGLRS